MSLRCYAVALMRPSRLALAIIAVVAAILLFPFKQTVAPEWTIYTLDAPSPMQPVGMLCSLFFPFFLLRLSVWNSLRTARLVDPFFLSRSAQLEISDIN